jgi:TRAP-type C4-dicarboxylate transport system permease small subunit
VKAAMRGYVRVVDGFNRGLGRIVMYGLFAMIGVLLWSSLSKTFFTPSQWTLEVAQFGLVAYFMLVAAVHVADQADHDHWHLPDAASGRVGVLQGHLAHSR